MRTTDPLAALNALIASTSPDPWISWDGTLYHVRDSSKPADKGSRLILSKSHAVFALDLVNDNRDKVAGWLNLACFNMA